MGPVSSLQGRLKLEIRSQLRLDSHPSLLLGHFLLAPSPPRPHPVWPRGNCKGRCGMLSRVSCMFHWGGVSGPQSGREGGGLKVSKVARSSGRKSSDRGSGTSGHFSPRSADTRSQTSFLPRRLPFSGDSHSPPTTLEWTQEATKS